MSPKLCIDQFWNKTLFLNPKYPIFTKCFQYSVLLIPPGIFWIFFLIFLTFKQYTGRKLIKIPCDFWYIFKLVCQIFLVILLVMEIILEWWFIKEQQYLDGIFLLSYSFSCLTLILVMLQTEIRRRTMHPICPILFIFWFTSALTYTLRFYCNVIKIVSLNAILESNIAFLCLSGAILFFYLLSLTMDCCSRYSRDRALTKISKPCPEEYASILSKLTFFWLDKYICAWYKREMTGETAFELRHDETSTKNTNMLEKVFLDKINKENGKKRNQCVTDLTSSATNLIINEMETIFPNNRSPGLVLFLSLMKIYSPPLMIAWLFKLAHTFFFIFAMPFLLKMLLQYIQEKNNTGWVGYLLAFAFLTAGVMCTICENACYFIAVSLSVRIRAAIIGMVYRKTLRLNNEVRSKFTSGEIVNLMSVDSERIMYWVVYSWFLISCPLEITIALLLLYQQLSYATFAGLGVILAVFPLNGIIMSLLRKFSEIELKWKDKRIKILSEILNGIKVLKMYAWEKSFISKVTSLREWELKYILRSSVLWSLTSVMWEIMPIIVMLVTFLTYAFMDKNNIITAEKVFVSLTLFNLMKIPMGILPWGLTESINASVSLKRIGQYLVSDELDTVGRYHSHDSSGQNDDIAVEICDGSFAWKKDDKVILNNINLEIHRGQLIAVVGKVGTGKSSLISVILGEMHRLRGSIKIQGNLAYVSQEAWIQNKSLKDNILFTEKYDETFYKKIVQVCSLNPDLEQLPAGDATEIGERGINLSGGQKQRVSLARAVYQNRDIYLLDDPLSAVDAHVGQHLFDNVISNNGILQGKTRILVTHGLNWLPKVDEVFVLDSNGSISERGSFNKLLKDGAEFKRFVQEYMEHNTRSLKNTNSVIINDLKLIEQLSESGEAVDQYTKLVSNSPPVAQFIEEMSPTTKTIHHRESSSPITFSGMTQTPLKCIENSGSCNLEESQPPNVSINPRNKSKSAIVSNKENINEVNKSIQSHPVGQLIDEEQAMIGKVRMSTYIMYIKSRGYGLFSMTLVLFIGFMGLQIFNNIRLKQFTEDESIHNASSAVYKNASYIPEINEMIRKRTEYYMFGYIYIGLAMFLILSLYWLAFTTGSLRAAKVMHKNLLYSILRSPMQFFDTTPSGRILNRFSKDMNVADHTVPMNISDAINSFFMILSSIAVVIYTTPLFAVIIIPVGILYYFIQRFYTPTSRQARRLDSIATSPIFNNFSETLQGVAVIRAFNEQIYFQNLNQQLIDGSSKFRFIQCSANRWLALRIDCLGNVMVFVAVLFAIINRQYLTASMVGLSISYSLQITDALNWLIRQFTELETNSVALERILEYSMIPSEAEWDILDSPSDFWPSSGNIVFKNYDLRYRPDLPLVLKCINLKLNAGEKIGIVGRTGAGKSSLNLALYRLVEPTRGEIEIDGIDISKLGLHDLRKNLTILPQDPVIFSGTLRENLDPFQKHSENELFLSLETAHLKEWVSTLSEGIDYECDDGGVNLSAGQKQLLCLARALLRKSKVLILDEATASVDVETDRLVMQTIRDCFRSSTVIVIAHRINTIIDMDKIIVMNDGHVVEMDTPQNLLAVPGGIFRSLAEESSNSHSLLFKD